MEVAKLDRITGICFRRSYLSLTRIGKDGKKHNVQQLYWCTTTAAKKNTKTEQQWHTHSLHYYRPSSVPHETSIAALTSCCMHVDRAPPAKCTPRLPPPTLALAISMSIANSQLRRPTSRPQVHTKQSKPPQRAYHLRKQNTRSAHFQLWSPHSLHSTTSAANHLRSIEAPLIYTTVTLKPSTMNIEDDNPNKQRRIFEHKRYVWVVRGASEDGMRKRRREEGNEVKWRHSFYSTHLLGLGNETWRYLTTHHYFIFFS